jgi:hypothetical protein
MAATPVRARRRPPGPPFRRVAPTAMPATILVTPLTGVPTRRCPLRGLVVPR